MLALSFNSFLTAVIMPTKITEDLRVGWTRYEFPAYLADIVPDLGVVREVKNNFVSETHSLTRFGLGMQMQHGFMTTPEGQACYRMHIRQIHQAMMEGLQLEALYALLNNGNWAINARTQIESWTGDIASAHLNRCLADEIRTWGITQSSSRGDVTMDMYAENISNLNSLTHNTYIMDSRIRVYLNTIVNIDNENTPDSKFKFSIGGGYNDTRGNKVWETRTLLVDEEAFNPLQRRAQIGEFVLASDRATSPSDYQNYQSSDRQIGIYSDDDDVFKTVSLQECHDNCSRFDKLTGYLRDFGNKRRNVDEKDRANDHLFHTIKGALRPLSFFGQMRPEHYTDIDYDCMAISALASATYRNPDTLKELNASVAYIDHIMSVINNIGHSDAFQEWVNVLAEKNTEIRSNNSDNVQGTAIVDFQNNGHNSLDIPVTAAEYSTNFNALKGKFQLPPTHGSYGGLRTIADLVSSRLWTANNVPFNIELVNDLPRHLDVWSQFIDQMVSMFPNSSFSTPRNAGEYFAIPRPQDIAFESYFGIKYPSRVLFMRKASAPADPEASFSQSNPNDRFLTVPVDTAIKSLNLSVLGNVSTVGGVWVYGANPSPLYDFGGGNEGEEIEIPEAGTVARTDNQVYWTVMEIVTEPTKGSKRYAFNKAVSALAMAGVKTGANVDLVKSAYRNIIEALNNSKEDPDYMDRAKSYVSMNSTLFDDASATISTIDRFWNGNRDFLNDTMNASGYYRAPIFIGRNAIQQFVQNPGTYDRLWAVPASHIRPRERMSEGEIKEAKHYYEHAKNLSSANMYTDYSRVGDIFEPASRGNVNTNSRLDIENLPLIQKLFKSYNQKFVERNESQRRAMVAMDESTTYGGLSDNTRSVHNAIDHYVIDENASVQQNIGSDEITESWSTNFRNVVRKLKGAKLIAALFFMFSPIQKSTLDSIISNNIMFPWNFIIARPHSTWETLTTIKCLPGDGLGNTFLGHLEFESSDDTTIHVTKASANWWQGAIVYDEKRVINIPNSFICGYVGGHGTGFISPHEYRGDFGTVADPQASIMCFTSPLHEKINNTRISVTGYPTWFTREGISINLQGITNDFGYNSAAYYNELYNFGRVKWGSGYDYVADAPARYNGREVSAANSICFAGVAVYTSMITHTVGSLSAAKGHWKLNQQGPGCHAARIGQDYFKEQPTHGYSNLPVYGVC